MRPVIEKYDLYPNQAQYRPGQQGHIELCFAALIGEELEVRAEFKRLHQQLWEQHL